MPKEQICNICKGFHPTYACTEKVDIKAKREAAYLEKSQKREQPWRSIKAEHEAYDKKIKRGEITPEEKVASAREELLKGEPGVVEALKETQREGMLIESKEE